LFNRNQISFFRKNGVDFFPEAPTSRGTHHLENLVTARQQGIRSAMIFLVQRGDVQVFSPNVPADLKFYEAFLKPLLKGVEIAAFSCEVTITGIKLKARFHFNGRHFQLELPLYTILNVSHLATATDFNITPTKGPQYCQIYIRKNYDFRKTFQCLILRHNIIERLQKQFC